MLSKKMQEALNNQVQAELFSSYLYLSMSAWFESSNLTGMAKWMKVQADEERGHGMKIFDYIIERGGQVTLKAIDAPQAKWDSPLAAFEAAYGHEQKVTAMINGLVDAAAAEKDHATSIMLQWFVSEQVEEEATALAIVEKLRLIGESTNGLFMMDHALGKRGSE